MIHFRCSDCGAAYSVPADQAGGWQYCATCQVDIPIPWNLGESAPIAPLEDSDLADNPRPWWNGIARVIGLMVAIQVSGIVLSLVFPSLILWILGAYLLTLIVFVGMSWMLGLRHALQYNRFSAIFFFLIPLYPVRYGIRHWPETRPCVMAFSLAFAWMTTPWIIGMPVAIVASFFENAKPVLADGTGLELPNSPEPVPQPLPPASPDIAQPAVENSGANAPHPQANPARPVPHQGFVKSRSTRIDPDGTMTTTITYSDGTVTTTVRHSKSKIKPSSEEIRRRFELRRKINDRNMSVGTVIVADITGTDRELVFGGRNGIYSRDSSPHAAAVHAGLIKVDQTAKVKITIVPKEDLYPALEQNGILSLERGSEPLSYKIELATDNAPPPKQ